MGLGGLKDEGVKQGHESPIQQPSGRIDLEWVGP